MQRGRFVTFEGVDGTGKTTQSRLLGQNLEAEGIKVLILREPGGTAISEKIRDILLDASQNNMKAETEVLLFEAARAQIVREVIWKDVMNWRLLIVWMVSLKIFDLK